MEEGSLTFSPTFVVVVVVVVCLFACLFACLHCIALLCCFFFSILLKQDGFVLLFPFSIYFRR